MASFCQFCHWTVTVFLGSVLDESGSILLPQQHFQTPINAVCWMFYSILPVTLMCDIKMSVIIACKLPKQFFLICLFMRIVDHIFKTNCDLSIYCFYEYLINHIVIIYNGGTVVEWISLSPHSKTVSGLILVWGFSLCRVCMFSLCLHSFPMNSVASSQSLNTWMWGQLGTLLVWLYISVCVCLSTWHNNELAVCPEWPPDFTPWQLGWTPAHSCQP